MATSQQRYVLSLDAFLDHLNANTSPNCTINFVGDGLLTYGDAVRESVGKRVHFADTIFNVPRGATVAYLGAQRLQRGECDSY